MGSLENFDTRSWDKEFSEEEKIRAVSCLEAGKVLYFPQLAFDLKDEEARFLDPRITDPRSKNVSYDPHQAILRGAICTEAEKQSLQAMMERYAAASVHFIQRLIPHYIPTLKQGKTSFRPVEIQGRKTSYRKDDTRLHVDAFPSNPTKGKRILRVFTNVNRAGLPRQWRIGEPFEELARRMRPRLRSPIFGMAQLLKLLKITKDLRTPYDHYMLQLHDLMKGDTDYQKTVQQEAFGFPPFSTWVVYTDQVSHAAMSGQHLFEQTFYMPVAGLYNEALSPLRVLERVVERQLV